MNNEMKEKEFISFVSPTFIREYINLEDNLLIVNKSEAYFQSKKFLVNF